jgi:hypothetical protein
MFPSTFKLDLMGIIPVHKCMLHKCSIFIKFHRTIPVPAVPSSHLLIYCHWKPV